MNRRIFFAIVLSLFVLPVSLGHAAEPKTPAADVLFALSIYNPTIEELRQAAALPGSRFPLNYDSESPAAILLPHLAALKGCMRVLELRAIAEL